jgi:hypothetical protein
MLIKADQTPNTAGWPVHGDPANNRQVSTASFDRDVSPRDIQSLADADALVGLFAQLGYDTSARLPQTSTALGIVNEALRRKIRRVERIADQEAGALQIYLFELDSVTVQATQAIARALRDRSPNFLLVLTSSYEDLDFVMLERELPRSNGVGFGPLRVVVRTRVLTVDRRNPGLVALRVLRRFTYTEVDADAQFDKLRSAYSVADWSEPHFNNRALFSDYYLNFRLRETSAWAEDPKPAYHQLRALYLGARERLAGQSDELVRTALIWPALEVLGFALAPVKGDQKANLELTQRGSTAAVSCLAYPWDRYLDGKDEQRDAARPNDNPGARVVTTLDDGPSGWAIVTNGKLWRLYRAEAHSRATNYYEIDLEETLAQADPSEPFRYFWLIFRAASFTPRSVMVEGEPRSLSFVDEIVHESAEYARALGNRLKDRIFEEVFPSLAEGFIAHIRQVDGGANDLSQERLDQVYRATLALLYRLLFLLYAEARHLLPVREQRGYWEVSLSRIKAEVAQAAGPLRDQAPKRLAQAYRKSDAIATSLYDRFLELARIVDRGDPAVNTPTYSGGLFQTEVDERDTSEDADTTRFLLRYKVPDLLLATALDRLARDIDDKRHDLVPIDYKSLGVRQLGSIYEGLLEFRLRLARQKMAIVRGKKTEEVLSYDEAVNRKVPILAEGRGKEAVERTLDRGVVYLENDRRERKASGSYYTPDFIVEYVVRSTVGPVLKEHLDRLRPKLREAELAYQQARKNQVAFQRRGMKGQDPEGASESMWRHVVDELFDFRILDPAMGSGHFLVEVVDYVTDTVLDFLNGFPWNPVQAQIRVTRETILAEMDRQGVEIDHSKLTDVNLLKRHVLKRCIYGVDLNPMAVELAKVSLWLDCFTLGAPLSFLDHHLKVGNSLVGVSVAEVQQLLERGASQQLSLFGQSRFAGIMLATDLMRRVGELSDVTADQVKQSRAEFERATDALAPFTRVLDVYTSRWFGNEPRKVRSGGNLVLHDPTVEFLRSELAERWLNANEDATVQLPLEYATVAEIARNAAVRHRFFHWELEFPEVFFGARHGSHQVVGLKDNPGFDAVVGNPPWVRQETLGESKAALESLHGPVYDSIADTYVYFLGRGQRILKRDHRLGRSRPRHAVKVRWRSLPR